MGINNAHIFQTDLIGWLLKRTLKDMCFEPKQGGLEIWWRPKGKAGRYVCLSLGLLLFVANYK